MNAVHEPGADLLADLTRRVAALEKPAPTPSRLRALSMVVFSGELDRLLAALTIATGAAACGMKVTLFFTFWGSAALKKAGRQGRGKSWIEWLFGWMLPGGFHKQKLSRLDLFGLGRRMMAREMRKKQVPDLPTLLEMAGKMDVTLNICEMSMALMGIRPEEIIDYPGLQCCGVAHFLEAAANSDITLFI